MTNLELLLIMKLFKSHTNEVIKANSLLAMGRPQQAVTGLYTYRKELTSDISSIKHQLDEIGEMTLDRGDLEGYM